SAKGVPVQSTAGCLEVQLFHQLYLRLTAKSQVEDRVAGLDSGADDYLPNPFDNREFIARVRALTRRGGEYTPKVLVAGNVTLDCSTFELKCGSSCIRLGSKEFQMLELLMRQTGRLISTEQFMEHIWGYDSAYDFLIAPEVYSNCNGFPDWNNVCSLRRHRD
ncbi:DNA-binding response regulator, partial [Pseudoflavonifractor sp. 524-17]|uniref:response regulator transcription factor n=1 Tax=Pseudoflavonifractor sp. 524-17 TaxID=2304577 RepID=UPI00137A079B